MVKIVSNLLMISLISACSVALHAQSSMVFESGGELTPELSSFNVHYYDLNLKVNPADSTVGGSVDVYFHVVQPTNQIELALDPGLTIHDITRTVHPDYQEASTEAEVFEALSFQRSDTTHKFRVDFKQTLQPGNREVIRINYSGTPRVAPRPPWNGGMVWSRTPSGDPWVGVAAQTTGSWVWWPNKDHPSDRADSVAVNITMPEDLVVASNGRLRGSSMEEEGWKTWNWFVSTPISNYNITLNAAPYETITDRYTSTAGDEMEIIFWILPEYMEQGQELFPQFAEQLRHMEEIVGPYPFRADKYGVAHSPYLGMEHQSIIAYGADFSNDNLFGQSIGFDDLHHHEIAHEWFGNLVTVYDWRDFWIHEGFGTYMQALYAEHLGGMESYRLLIDHFRQRISQNATVEVAPRKTMSSLDITQGNRGGDIYFKGAMFLHTLRYLIGDEHFLLALRRFAYPDPEMEMVTDGSHMRFATTDDFLNLTEQITGMNLDWVFEVYLRQPALPKLHLNRMDGLMTLQWEVPEEVSFPMPIQIRIDREVVTFSPNSEGRIALEISEEVDVEIDPDGWVLMEVRGEW
tara:strand:+ start:617 stop:2344 length:1728 start_codon:yes stop_codon:yes gene_type:complete